MKNNKSIATYMKSIDTQNNAKHKTNTPTYFPKKMQTKHNHAHILNKSQSNKLELTNISTSLSLKKEQAKVNPSQTHKEAKNNPQSRTNEPKLGKTASTQRFMLRNAMYVRQKTLRMQNQQRKKLYGLNSDCKFQPQIQMSKHYQKSQCSNTSESSGIKEQKLQNMGIYQYNYHKKIEYQQFGYAKKNVQPSIKNKDIKKMLKESVERFNMKMNQKKKQETTQKEKAFIAVNKIDINEDLIWITDSTAQKQYVDELVTVQNQKQKGFNIKKCDSFSIDAPQDHQLLCREQAHSNSQILVQVQQNRSEDKADATQLQSINPKSLLQGINDISEIPRQECSLTESDIFSSQLRHRDSDVVREVEQDWLHKCFRKENCNQKEIAQNAIGEADSLAEQHQVSNIPSAEIMQQQGVVQVQLNTQRVDLQQQLQVTGFDTKEIQHQQPQVELIDVNINQQHAESHQVWQVDFTSLTHPLVYSEIYAVCTDSIQSETHDQITEQTETKQLEKMEQALHNNLENQIEVTYDAGYEESMHQQEKIAVDQLQQGYVQKQQYEQYVIDDFGNVILNNSIQVHNVGLCKILVIPELPEQEARTSYS